MATADLGQTSVGDAELDGKRRHRLAPNKIIQITAGNYSRLLHMLVYPREASEKISPPSQIQDRCRIGTSITER